MNQIIKENECLKQEIYQLIAIVKNGSLDLHVHSTASDGSDTPEQLAKRLVEAKLKTVALTDHDTLDGIDSFRKAIKEKNDSVLVIPATELSVDYMDRAVHLLAYFLANTEHQIEPYLMKQRENRNERNIRLCNHLSRLGYEITLEELVNVARKKVVGRPHVAKLLCQKGYFSSNKEAFELLLGNGKQGYVQRIKAPIKAAIDVVKKAKGIPVLAHPFKYGWKTETVLYEKISPLVEMGLCGVECIHGETTVEIAKRTAAVADQLGVIKTMGSDYHGTFKPNLNHFSADTPVPLWMISAIR